jgi:hypothetical protein
MYRMVKLKLSKINPKDKKKVALIKKNEKATFTEIRQENDSTLKPNYNL